MLILVCQTVFPKAQLLLLGGKGELLDKQVWLSDKDEIRQVLPRLEKLLRRNKADWKDLSKIVSVVGIGNFSSTRIGVTIANILSLAAGAALLELKLEKEVSADELQRLVKAKMVQGWTTVRLAKPVYRAAPLISPSKKPKF